MRAGSGKPTEHPDSAPWADDGAGYLVVRVRADGAGIEVNEPLEISVDLDRVLTVREVARLVRVSESTWRRWVRAGVAPSRDVPAGWRLRTLQRWQDRKRKR